MDALVATYVERRGEQRDRVPAPSHHAAIQGEAEVAFPGRRLRQLIGAGAYGLVGNRPSKGRRAGQPARSQAVMRQAA
jgi:hypothetical protein